MNGGVTVFPFHQYITSVPVLQSIQSDLGITLNSTLLAAGTTPPAVTFTGTCPGYGFRVEVNDTSGGTGLGQAKFRYYANGFLVASGITTAASVVLSSPLAGITLAFAAGPYNANNIYYTTVSQWNDQTANALHYTQATQANQAVYGDDGLNGMQLGYPSFAFSTSARVMASSLNLPLAGTTPTWMCGIALIQVGAAGGRIAAPNSASNALLVLTGASTDLAQFNGSTVNTTAALGTTKWGQFEAYFSNTTNDYCKYGTSSVTGANAGNSAALAGRVIGKHPGGTFLQHSLISMMYTQGKPTAAEITALRAAMSLKYGANLFI